MFTFGKVDLCAHRKMIKTVKQAKSDPESHMTTLMMLMIELLNISSNRDPATLCQFSVAFDTL